MAITRIVALVTLSATFSHAISFHDRCLNNNITTLPADDTKLNHYQKCYISCLFNCTGYLSENGELEKHDILITAPSYFGKLKANELTKNFEQCLSQVGKLKADSCEAKYETALCWAIPMNAYMNMTMRDMHAEPLLKAVVGNGTGIYNLLMFHLFSRNICIK